MAAMVKRDAGLRVKGEGSPLDVPTILLTVSFFVSPLSRRCLAAVSPKILKNIATYHHSPTYVGKIVGT